MKEYINFDLSQIEELVKKIVDDHDFARSDMLRGIKYVRTIEKLFIENIDTKSFHYGILDLLKEEEFLSAFGCVFKINIEKNNIQNEWTWF